LLHARHLAPRGDPVAVSLKHPILREFRLEPLRQNLSQTRQKLSPTLEAVTRRQRESTPPVPSGYGSTDVDWQPSADHDPLQVAILNLQHRVLCEVRRHLGTGVAGSLSELLGMSLRSAQRITAGDHSLGVDEIIQIAWLFGDSVLEAAIPHTVVELFPEPYRSYLGNWTAGERLFPTFAHASVPVMIAWAAPAGDLSRWLGNELHAGRLGLVDESVVAHHIAECLALADIPSSLIMVVDRSARFARWMRLDVLTRIPTRLHLGYLLDPVEDPLIVLRDTFSNFYEILSHDGHRTVILCFGHRISGQLRVYAPNLSVSQPGEAVTIPFQVAAQLGVPAAREHGAQDIVLTTEASASSDPAARVLVVRVGKST
jgi:hypothetical protein